MEQSIVFTIQLFVIVSSIFGANWLNQRFVAAEIKRVDQRVEMLQKSMEDRFSQSDLRSADRFSQVDHQFQEVNRRLDKLDRLRHLRSSG